MKPNKGFITVFMMVLISISLSTFSRAAFDTFSDVPNDSPFHESIFYLAERGIVCGEGNGRYVPDAPVTVRQWAMMLCRALGNDDPLNYDDDCIRQGYSDGWLEMTAITAPDSDLAAMPSTKAALPPLVLTFTVYSSTRTRASCPNRAKFFALLRILACAKRHATGQKSSHEERLRSFFMRC